MNAPQSRRFARFKSAKRSRQRLDCGGFSTAFPFGLANLRFALQSIGMETNQAAEHLQVIRTLMERSALYRRALAPIMLYCGVVGIVAGITGWALKINSDCGFVWFWSGVAVLALTGSFLLVRRQAFKEAEAFWSPPTRRVAQAMLPPLVIGLFAALLTCLAAGKTNDTPGQSILTLVWASLYGCALHSAGFFISRGFRIFGWVFIILGCLFVTSLSFWKDADAAPNCLMGGFFGGLHLAYGIYLYFTENRNTAP